MHLANSPMKQVYMELHRGLMLTGTNGSTDYSVLVNTMGIVNNKTGDYLITPHT